MTAVNLWRKIDAEGGTATTDYERGYNAGLTAALRHVEALGYREGVPVLPAETVAELVEALRTIFARQDPGNGNGPGHAHDQAGIWDDDLGNRATGHANLPCEWCAVWANARAVLAKVQPR